LRGDGEFSLKNFALKPTARGPINPGTGASARHTFPMAGIQISGLLANSAFDWKSVVDQLVAVSGAPIKKLEADKVQNTAEIEALAGLDSALTELQDSVQAMRADDIFAARTVSSDLVGTTWKSSSVTGAAIGSYTFDVTQLATRAQLTGATDIGSGLAPTADVSGVTIANLSTAAAVTAGTFTVAGRQVSVATTDSVQDVFDAIADATTVAADDSLATAPMATAVTAGTFTVNGQQVSVALSSTLQDVFAAIATATAGDVTGSYDSATGKVTLTKTTPGAITLGNLADTSNFVTAMKLASGTDAVTSSATIGISVAARYDHATDGIVLTKASGELVLGAANDTSNFLAVMKLANNGGAMVASSAALGSLKPAATLANAGFRDAITAVDGAGAGTFTINGVTISYNINTSTLGSVINTINDAGAGVTAVYDPTKDRVVLTNKSTGDVGIALSESAGGLLDAMGLTAGSGGVLVHGDNAKFTVNGGDVISSTSNTLDATVHGITGLSVTVNTETAQTLQVESDTITMEQAISGFIEKFNAVQDFIEENTQVTVNGTDVSAAVLSKNREVQTWASKLRALAFDEVSGLTGDLKRLDHLGIDFDSTTSHLRIKDSGKLATALGDSPEEVDALFLNSGTGIVPRFYSYLTTVSAAGSSERSSIGAANDDLDEQIATLQARLDAQREILTSAFIRMLDAQSAAQSQSTYLTNTFFKNNSG
jgi:flagellar hook-associated protein 2